MKKGTGSSMGFKFVYIDKHEIYSKYKDVFKGLR